MRKKFFSMPCIPNPWSVPVRYTIVFISTIANMLEYALRDNMSISMVAMVGMSDFKTNSDLHQHPNSTNLTWSETPVHIISSEKASYTFNWSPRTQGTILGAFYYGYIISHFLGGQVCAWIGPRIAVALSIFFSLTFTLVIPFAAFNGPLYLATVRAALGTSQGLLTPSLYGLFSKWIPSEERSTSLALLVVGGNLGSLTTMLVSGYLCEQGFAGGWPSVFYFHALVAAIFLVVWVYAIRNEPGDHPTISDEELRFLAQKLGRSPLIGNQDQVTVRKIPWSGILLSPAIWSIGIAKFAGKWGFITWETQLPTYLAQALHMNMAENSLVNALRYFSMSISLLFAGYLSDWIDKRNKISKTLSRKLFESVALFGPAIMTLIIPFAGKSVPLIVVAFTLSMVLYGFCAGGDNPMVVDMSPKHAGAIYGFTAGLSSFPGPLAPYFVGYILELNKGDLGMWDYVFYSCSLFYFTGAMFFIIFGTSEEQDLEVTRVSKPKNEQPKDIELVNSYFKDALEKGFS